VIPNDIQFKLAFVQRWYQMRTISTWIELFLLVHIGNNRNPNRIKPKKICGTLRFFAKDEEPYLDEWVNYHLGLEL
jgi:hypothetical protein